MILIEREAQTILSAFYHRLNDGSLVDEDREVAGRILDAFPTLEKDYSKLRKDPTIILTKGEATAIIDLMAKAGPPMLDPAFRDIYIKIIELYPHLRVKA